MSDGLERFIEAIKINYGELLTEEDVSELLGVSKMYLCKLRKKEDAIPFIRIGKLIKYFKSDFIDWLRVCKLRSHANNLSRIEKGQKKEKQVQSG